MNLKFANILILLTLLYSCRNASQESTSGKSKTKSDVLNCYKYLDNKDTIILKTIKVNGFITGTLVYKLYEKGANKGTIQGKMQGNILIADYSLISESAQSVRQIAFKKVGNDYIEGHGEMENHDGKSIFKNTDSLKYDQSIILKTFNCEN